MIAESCTSTVPTTGKTLFSSIHIAENGNTITFSLYAQSAQSPADILVRYRCRQSSIRRLECPCTRIAGLLCECRRVCAEVHQSGECPTAFQTIKSVVVRLSYAVSIHLAYSCFDADTRDNDNSSIAA